MGEWGSVDTNQGFDQTSLALFILKQKMFPVTQYFKTVKHFASLGFSGFNRLRIYGAEMFALGNDHQQGQYKKWYNQHIETLPAK